MRLTRTSSADEMVASFLRAEIASPRQGGCIKTSLERHGWPASLVRNADLSCGEENLKRSEILGECRGWQGNHYILSGMPGDVAWHWAELERDDVANAEGANYEEWRDLSGGTRRVGDAVSVVVSAARHATGYAADIAISAASIAERYDRGERLEPPILVAPTSLIRLVVVEGHTRLVGWMISKQPGPLAVIVGLSDQIPGWGWY